MKFIFLIFTFILMTSEVQSQIDAQFRLQSKSSDGCIKLILFSSQNYYLVDERENSDHLVNINFLSFGTYSNKGVKLILTDKLNGFEIELEKSKQSYQVKRGFYAIRNKYFEKKGDEFSIEEDIYLTNANLFEEYDRSKSFVSKPIIVDSMSNKFEYANCYCDDDNRGCRLSLLKNGMYNYYYCNILLSKGMWGKHQNKLNLKDLDMNFEFYFEILETGELNPIKIIPFFPKEENFIPFN